MNAASAITKAHKRKATKLVVFVACLLPLAWLVWLGLSPGPGGSGLGANPQEFVNRYLGDWALRFLMIALALTPLRMLSGWNGGARFRRMLGLYAFFYVCLHVTSYVALDQGFAWAEIWADIIKRTYITVGMVSLVLLVPLALTSTKGMITRLGAARWRNLHRAVYVILPLGCLHFFMMRKGIQLEPLIYSAIAVALLAARVIHALRRSRRHMGAAAT